MKTTLIHYSINTDTREGLDEWSRLRDRMTARGVKLFDVYDTGTFKPMPEDPAESVTLETDFVTNNQWNTTDGRRVFDFYQGIVPNKKIKRGHYLDVTNEMRALRDNTHKCGYCGAHYDRPSICNKCITGEYLTPDNLPLLRTQAASDTGTRPPLTDNQAGFLSAAHVASRRLVNAREAERQKAAHARELRKAQTLHDGYMWILDNTTLTTGNVIMYDVGAFTFGWREPVTDRADIIKQMEGFPFEYNFKGDV